jgi:CYTH domain-containing protein
MGMEIERKFLVDGDFRNEEYKASRIVQGYICADKGRTVRVRINGEKGYLTIKGPSTDDGLSRYEFEREIPVSDAEEMLGLCLPGVIDKVRHLVRRGNHTWEVDEFLGDNDGLIVAEIELSYPDEAFEKPSWVGEEVTADRRYYNSELTKNPYKNWKDK